MAERPILFNDAMVRAILSGAKTRTRRPITKTSRLADGFAMYSSGGVVTEIVNTFEGDVIDAKPITCPYGAPGDRLYVREAWGPWRQTSYEYDDWEPVREPLDGSWKREFEEYGIPTIEYRATSKSMGPWQPSVLMPRSISRISLRVTDVRVERVQDISEDDAKAEGVAAFQLSSGISGRFGMPVNTARYSFAHAWTDAYGPESWTANPWVWVVSFEREEVARG